MARWTGARLMGPVQAVRGSRRWAHCALSSSFQGLPTSMRRPGGPTSEPYAQQLLACTYVLSPRRSPARYNGLAKAHLSARLHTPSSRATAPPRGSRALDRSRSAQQGGLGGATPGHVGAVPLWRARQDPGQPCPVAPRLTWRRLAIVVRHLHSLGLGYRT